MIKKKMLGEGAAVRLELPTTEPENEVRKEPIEIVERRLVQKGNEPGVLLQLHDPDIWALPLCFLSCVC